MRQIRFRLFALLAILGALLAFNAVASHHCISGGYVVSGPVVVAPAPVVYGPSYVYYPPQAYVGATYHCGQENAAKVVDVLVETLRDLANNELSGNAEFVANVVELEKQDKTPQDKLNIALSFVGVTDVKQLRMLMGANSPKQLQKFRDDLRDKMPTLTEEQADLVMNRVKDKLHELRTTLD